MADGERDFDAERKDREVEAEADDDLNVPAFMRRGTVEVPDMPETIDNEATRMANILKVYAKYCAYVESLMSTTVGAINHAQKLCDQEIKKYDRPERSRGV